MIFDDDINETNPDVCPLCGPPHTFPTRTHTPVLPWDTHALPRLPPDCSVGLHPVWVLLPPVYSPFVTFCCCYHVCPKRGGLPSLSQTLPATLAPAASTTQLLARPCCSLSVQRQWATRVAAHKRRCALSSTRDWQTRSVAGAVVASRGRRRAT